LAHAQSKPLSNEQKDAGPSLPAFWADRIASLFRRKFALQFTHFDKVFCGISKPPLRRQQQLKNSLGEVAILHVLEMRIHPKPQRKIKLGKGDTPTKSLRLKKDSISDAARKHVAGGITGCSTRRGNRRRFSLQAFGLYAVCGHLPTV
jgi:hypothetical protein